MRGAHSRATSHFALGESAVAQVQRERASENASKPRPLKLLRPHLIPVQYQPQQHDQPQLTPPDVQYHTISNFPQNPDHLQIIGVLPPGQPSTDYAPQTTYMFPVAQVQPPSKGEQPNSQLVENTQNLINGKDVIDINHSVDEVAKNSLFQVASKEDQHNAASNGQKQSVELANQKHLEQQATISDHEHEFYNPIVVNDHQDQVSYSTTEFTPLEVSIMPLRDRHEDVAAEKQVSKQINVQILDNNNGQYLKETTYNAPGEHSIQSNHQYPTRTFIENYHRNEPSTQALYATTSKPIDAVPHIINPPTLADNLLAPYIDGPPQGFLQDHSAAASPQQTLVEVDKTVSIKEVLISQDHQQQGPIFGERSQPRKLHEPQFADDAFPVAVDHNVIQQPQHQSSAENQIHSENQYSDEGTTSVEIQQQMIVPIEHHQPSQDHQITYHSQQHLEVNHHHQQQAQQAHFIDTQNNVYEPQQHNSDQSPIHINHYIDRPYPVEKIVDRPYPVDRIVEKIIDRPVAVEKIVEKEVRVPYPVDRVVERIVDRPVEKIIEKPVPFPYPVEVEKIVDRPYPVDRIVEKEVRVPYAVEKIVDRPYEVEKIVEKTVQVPVDRVVEKFVDVPVPVSVEKIVDRPYPVEKIVEKLVDRPVPYEVQVPVAVHIPYAVHVPVHIPYEHSISAERYVPSSPHFHPKSQTHFNHIYKGDTAHHKQPDSLKHVFIPSIPFPASSHIYHHSNASPHSTRLLPIASPYHIYRPKPVYGLPLHFGAHQTKTTVPLFANHNHQQTYAGNFDYATNIYKDEYLGPPPVANQHIWSYLMPNNSHYSSPAPGTSYAPSKPPSHFHESTELVASGSIDHHHQLHAPNVLSGAHRQNLNFGKSMRWENGFKPPLIPSVQIDEHGMPIDPEHH